VKVLSEKENQQTKEI